MTKLDIEEKRRMLNASLEEKIQRSKMLIMDWYAQFEGKVYVSFSGGKDSTVLLHLVRSVHPDVVAVFADTGLEYPELKSHVKTFDNVEVIRPKLSFKKALEKFGYPVISKEQSQFISEYRSTKSEKLKKIRIEGNKWGRGKISKKWYFMIDAPFKITNKCCDTFKKDPFKRYEKKTGKKGIVGVMAGESLLRRQSYYKNECNAFHTKRPLSKPLLFWNEEDIWKYTRDFNVTQSEIYTKHGYKRTGCMFCAYGLDREVESGEETRFERMKRTHPKLYKYCMEKLGMKRVLEFYLQNTKKKENQLELFD